MNRQQREQRIRSVYTSSRSRSDSGDSDDEFMMNIPSVKLMNCFRVPTPKKSFFGRRKNWEHWDTFKRKYPTDSFQSTSINNKW
ncbi:MAG: hypothetical protein ACI8RD_008491 [Bacillariaceae sp.]|jgi:hypothetical protein